FEQRTNIEIEEKTDVYFPPAHLINYSFAANGYKNWLPKLHEKINTIITASNEGKALLELKAFQLDVDADSVTPDTSSSVDYKNWHAQNAGGKIRALCLPRTRAFMVRFSDERYIGAKINVTNRQGGAVFYADAERRERETEVLGVKDLDDTILGYGAVFYDLDNHFDPNGKAEDQMFQFSIKPEAADLDLNNENNTYNLVERLRFPIKTLAGDFDVINGDAFSLEECLVRQFPQRYPNIIKNIADQQNKPDAIKGSESLLHAFNTNQDKLKLIGGAFAADSTASFLRIVGMGFYNGIDENNEGLKLLRGSINLAFNIYDLAGKVNDAMKFIIDNYVESVSDSVQTINRARALSAFTNDVAPAELWSDTVAANVDGIADNMNEVALPNRLKKVFKTSQSMVGGLSKAMDFYSVFNDAHGVYVSYDKMSTAVTNTHTLMDDYAYKVHFKDAIDDVSKNLTRTEIEDGKKELQTFQDRHVKTMQVSQVGDLKFINVTFAFDRAGFAKDESFADLIDFLKSLQIPFDLILSGHTCSIGTLSYNLALSERRAQSVKKILLDAGLAEIPDRNISIRAFGETKPVASNATEENRKKNRRVDAVIILKKIGRFKPSREGMESVEKYRALSSIHTAAMGDSISKSVVSTLDLIAGLPPTNLAHLGFSLLWTVGGVLCDGANLLNDAVFGEAYLKTVNDFNQHDRLSAANQALLLERTKWKKNISAGYFLEAQVRLKAEALNGLMQLLIRCSLETDNVVKRLKFDIDNVSDDRTSYTYDDNLEYYQVQSYVEKFILSDGWKLFAGVLHPVALDDYWLYLIKTNRLEEKLKKDDDLSWQDKAIEVANEYAKEAGSYADLVKDNIIDAAGDLVLSRRYIANNVKSSFHLEREYLTTARFKEFFPVHYTQSDNLEELFIAAKPDFSDLDSDIYLGMMHSVKEAGADSKTWMAMSRWLESKRNWISPLDEIRICILLDPDSGIVKEYIDNGAIAYIPYKVMPTRVDGLNMSGPANDGFIQKLKYEDLTTDELELLGDHNKDDVKDSLYGAIVYPYFKLGKKIIQGTKPLANAVSAWLNVTSEHSLSNLFNWDQRWDMDYKYEVVLGYKTETLPN
ncbi:MAG: OmpA family protein, partial [Oleispira sp.]|nr:OmpA family protein [Oleispira sp.]